MPGRYRLPSLGSGSKPAIVVLPAGEATKSLDQAARLYDELVVAEGRSPHAASSPCGGGVIGDLAGFVAATYARGLPLADGADDPARPGRQLGRRQGRDQPSRMPRTSSARSTSRSESGSTPRRSQTLPDPRAPLRLAEVVKYGVILDAELFRRPRSERRTRSWPATPAALRPIVAAELPAQGRAWSARTSARRPACARSSTSATRSATRSRRSPATAAQYQHGEAVAVGMVAESRLAERLGWIGADVVERLVALLERLGLPTSAAGLDPGRSARRHGPRQEEPARQVRFVLPRALGRVELTDAPARPTSAPCSSTLITPTTSQRDA